MPTLGEVINNLAQKAGVAGDDAKLKALLASPELATLQVDDTLVTSLESGLLSIDAAKNNHPEVKKKYFADAYDGIDKQLIKLIENDTFDQADLDEIRNEKSTSKKQELIITKLKAAKASAKGADKDEINRQLAAAHDAARLAKAEVETVKTSYEGKIKNIQLDSAIKAVFGNYKTIYDEIPGDTTGSIRAATLRALIAQGLQDKNAELRTDENGSLQLVSKDGSTNVFGSNNVQLTPQSFLDQTFAPILKVSGPPKPAAPPRQQPGTTPPVVNAQSEASASFVKSHVDQVLADMAMTKAPMI